MAAKKKAATKKKTAKVTKMTKGSKPKAAKRTRKTVNEPVTKATPIVEYDDNNNLDAFPYDGY